MLTEILQGLVRIGYSIFRIVSAVVICVAIVFAIVVVGELSHCSSSPSDNAVHWRP